MKGFSKTRTPNMWRNDASGRFYAVARSPGKPFATAHSLKTDKETVAKLRLEKALDQIRASAGPDTLRTQNLTLGTCVEAYLRGKREEQIKPLSLKYCALSVQMIRKHLARFDARLVETFTPYDCKVLCDRLRAKYSARRFNGALWSLRGILEVAKKAKVIKDNPADEIKPNKIHNSRQELPDDAKFQEFMVKLRRLPSRSDALVFARIMALTGHRPESVRRLRAEHVDLKRHLVRWPPIKHNTQFNEVPMSEELETILRALLAEHKGNGPLVPIKDPKKALHTASREAGLEKPMTSRMFRHFFTTRALEAGIPIPEVAAMRGDKDGGAMLLRTYVHPRLERMREMVNKLPGTGPEGLEKWSLRTADTKSGKRKAESGNKVLKIHTPARN